MKAIGYNNLANVHKYLQDYDKALLIINKAISVENRNPLLYSHRANIYKNLGKQEKAQKIFNTSRNYSQNKKVF